jgi:regulator of protease activity HflC (stomatin/prohibitin superfamily)
MNSWKRIMASFRGGERMADQTMTSEQQKAPEPAKEAGFMLKIVKGQGLKTGAISSMGVSAFAVLIFWLIWGLLLGNPTSDLTVWYFPFNYLFYGLVFLSAGLLFFVSGLRLLPTAHVGIKLLLGKRKMGDLYGEGWCWHWPGIGGILSVDISVHQLSLTPDDLDDVYDSEKIRITVDADATYRVGTDTTHANALSKITSEAVFDFITYANPLATFKNEMADEVRSFVSKHTYSELNAMRTTFSNKLTKDLNKQMKKSRTGLHVIAIQIGSIRLPADIEEAQESIRREELEVESDMRDTQTLGDQIELLKKTGLSPDAAVLAVQASRGEREVKSYTGLDGSMAGVAGALATTVAEVQKPATSPKKESKPPAGGNNRRRQGNYRG